MRLINNLVLLISNGGVMLCCVLPAILVSLGLGSSLATFLSEYPIFIKITSYKDYIFLFVFFILSFNGYILYKNNKKVCEINNLNKECIEVKRVSKLLYFISIFIFLISLYLSYGY